MPSISPPGRLLNRELEARDLSANRLALDLGVPSGRVTDIINGRRSISADTAVKFFSRETAFLLSFMTVREQVICIDDLERRGKNLDVVDVLGLISFLCEQRKCKVWPAPGLVDTSLN